jgi:hypothetical protein
MKLIHLLVPLVALCGVTTMPIIARTAEAGTARSTSPFAGTYSGQVVGGGGVTYASRPFWLLSVTVSDTGRISGVANYFPPSSGYGPPSSPLGDGSARGSVSADGSLSLMLSDGTTLRVAATLGSDLVGNLFGVTADWSWSIALVRN